jgi:hypothetical protein
MHNWKQMAVLQQQKKKKLLLLLCCCCDNHQQTLLTCKVYKLVITNMQVGKEVITCIYKRVMTKRRCKKNKKLIDLGEENGVQPTVLVCMHLQKHSIFSSPGWW